MRLVSKKVVGGGAEGLCPNKLARKNIVKAAALLCAALLTLLGCGGGGGDDDNGGGGGGGDGGGTFSFSMSALVSAFPSFNESGLTIDLSSAEKWYYYDSIKAPNQYRTTLLRSSFRNDAAGLNDICGDPYDYYKVDSSETLEACADIGSVEDGNFKTLLYKYGGAPSDAELNAFFGSVPGRAYYVDRFIMTPYDTAYTNAAASYLVVLSSNGFTCAGTGTGTGDSCHKTIGNLKYEVIMTVIKDDDGDLVYGVVYWSIYGGGGYPSAELSCPVNTNSQFDAYDYSGNANAAFAALDPLGVYQWYLKNWKQKSGSSDAAKTINEDLNVTPVWNMGIKGKGVTIGIVDSGTDFTHPDLAPAYRSDLSFNYFSGSNDPYPVKTGSGACPHGTMTAGIAGARGGNGGVMGVAPQVQLAGMNLGIGCYFNSSESSIMDAWGKEVDISSNSWGFIIPGYKNVLFEAEIVRGADHGRGGKGRIYVFAAGNSRRIQANGNYDSMQSVFPSISVAALASNGAHTNYSNKGANLLVSAYGGAITSDGYSDASIFTTDIFGCAKGKSLSFESPPPSQTYHRLNNCGQYTAYMNGTSAAAPMVSGVVALMLEANPNLTWRDVRYILATTARKNDPTNIDWIRNGAGYWVNHNYGFGAVDAYSAVKKAQNFTSLGTMKKIDTTQDIDTPVRFNSNIEKTIKISGSDINKVEFVYVGVDIDDSSTLLKLNITLTSPNGTKSELAYNDYTGTGNMEWRKNMFNGGFRFGTARHLDEAADGDWKLTISGGTNENVKFNNWRIAIFGRSN